MSTHLINKYYSEFEKIKRFGGSAKETVIRNAFYQLLNDQYKEKKPSDPTIAEKFNTYLFADNKEKVIYLLQRVCTVSVETVRIVRGMGN